ncbi:hypothetical protein [Sinomonas atrocyanea]|uniref:hypothetical protein n=1 Tax=Sinomonas atrocyanea TaxID=37927 RepID=UPI003D97410E
MDLGSIVPAASGAVIGGMLSIAGGAWQARRTAARTRRDELRKRSEDAARDAADILIDIRRWSRENLDADDSRRSLLLTSEGRKLVADRVSDLRRAARLIVHPRIAARILEAADFLSAPSEFQHLLFESPAETARSIEVWISNNVTAFLTDRELPADSREVEAYRATYAEALIEAEEHWKLYEEWEVKERARLRAECETDAG